MVNMFKRMLDKRNIFLFIVAASICSMASLLYASMQRVTNANYALLALCGGLKGESDFIILFSLWIVPSMMMAFLIGTAVDRELKGYRYIAPRYGSQNRWLASIILNIVSHSICCSILMVVIGVCACLFYGGLKFSPLDPSILEGDTVIFEYWMSNRYILSELLTITMLRFTRIGLIMLSARMIPKYPVHVGIVVVLVLELISLINEKKAIPLFTYFSACSIGIPLTFVLVTGVTEIFCIIGIGIVLFRFATKRGQI